MTASRLTEWRDSRLLLACPTGRDTSGLRLLIPQCSQLLIIAISNIQTTGVGCGKVYGRPLDSLNPTRIKTLLITGSTQRMTFWPTTTLWTSIYAKPLEQPGMYPGHARWDLIQTL